MYVIVMKSESCDTYYFTADRKLSSDELDKFIKENLSHEWDEEWDSSIISDIEFLEINKLIKIE